MGQLEKLPEPSVFQTMTAEARREGAGAEAGEGSTGRKRAGLQPWEVGVLVVVPPT